MESEYVRRLYDGGGTPFEVEGGHRQVKNDLQTHVAVQSTSAESMKNNADDLPPAAVKLDRPISSSTLNMGKLSVESRKRTAGSEIQMPDVPPRQTASPQRSCRQGPGNPRSPPDDSGKGHSPRKLQKSQSSHQLPQTQQPTPLSRQNVLPRIATSHQQPISTQSKRAIPLYGSPSPAVIWSKHRPRGPQFSVRDSITVLISLFGKRLTAPGFSFSHSTDDITAFDDAEDLSPNATIVKEPDSRPISQQQLAAEVKGIYSGLVMVENKCIHVVNQQTQAMQQAESGDEQARYSLRIDQFQALIALHRTLLHEHHDFFHASQHPSAGSAIKDLALRYSMPARMWKHGIHNFLELLRHRLPESLDYMLAFIYLSYQMMALLYETVSSFEDTWIECLGDLGRYRMAIEDEDPRDREVWTGVARFWYMKAVDKNPSIGRLYHHLAILARNHPVQQASSYCRSLTAVQPFISSRESIMTLFEPTVARAINPGSRPVSVDTWFVVCHACLFRVPNTAGLLDQAMHNFLSQLDAQITKRGEKWREDGAFIATCNIGAILKYGCTDSDIRSMIAPDEKPSSRPSVPEPRRDGDWLDPDDITDDDLDKGIMAYEWRLALDTLHVVLRRIGDPNVLPLIHVMLVFFWQLSLTQQGPAFLERSLEFGLLSAYLNGLEDFTEHNPQLPHLNFPTSPQTLEQPLPEDFLLRGQIYANGVFPHSWFESASATDMDERSIEQPTTMTKMRVLRVKWLATKLAFGPAKVDAAQPGAHAKWLDWNARSGEFFVIEKPTTSVEQFPSFRRASGSPSSWSAARSSEADYDSPDHDQMLGLETAE